MISLRDPLVFKVTRRTVKIANEHFKLIFDLRTGRLSLGDGTTVEPSCVVASSGVRLGDQGRRAAVLISDPVLSRLRVSGSLGGEEDSLLEYSMTIDVFQTRNIHIYSKIRALSEVSLSEYNLPELRVGGKEIEAYTTAEEERTKSNRATPLQMNQSWVHITKKGMDLGLIVTKKPWYSKWNEFGAFGYGTLEDASLDLMVSGSTTISFRGEEVVTMEAGDTLESNIILRIGPTSVAATRNEGTHFAQEEILYQPEPEFAQHLTWEVEEGWLGPPILEGDPTLPKDQLVERPLGLNVLSGRRFSWNNEDFSMFYLTGKDRYWDTGIKKAYALMDSQTDGGGWHEGVQFFNLPPEHYQGYATYISTIFLLEAYDATGFERFLDAARRVKGFWGGEPPQNGYTREAEDEYWYRHMGFIDAKGNTDERHVVNAHVAALMTLAMLYERTADDEVLDLLVKGVKGFRTKIPLIQKPSGQFYYSISQIDPSLERDSDPPYLKSNLIPQIEDVYTVPTSYRLMVVNRVVNDPEITEAVRRALTYWWTRFREGKASTYRSYAVITFALAAGEIDLAFASAIPTLLKDRDLYTSIYRGYSSMLAPKGLRALRTIILGLGNTGVDVIYLRRTEKEYLFALVNAGHPAKALRMEIEGDEQQQISGIIEIDPRNRSEKRVTLRRRGKLLEKVSFVVDGLQEYELKVYSAKLRRRRR